MLNRFLRLARQTAPLLGPRWTAEIHHATPQNGAALVHPDGRRIVLLPVYRRPSHVEVTVHYPKAPVTLYAVDKPSTQFRTDRPPAALADAITAKVLPVDNSVYPKVVAAAAASRQTDEQQHAFAQRLAALVPGAELTRNDPSPWVEYRAGRGSIERMTAQVLSGNRHTVEFRYVDTETLETLLRAYGEVVQRQMSAAVPPPAQ
ncbi:hypothetical protein OG897_32395 [Streptomyces sp. NBC_00237]|uniref:hypothetical protein n=1 Tax=Streptomyces sp. NBC_00237 TaxID=2975687 RepID=UPI002253B93C|nr:hypothetical protein [Streptomyces sp. NBC_00237]MCX5206099.1 hypothetical protein [Streptomyces sp. NBC_00237]